MKPRPWHAVLLLACLGLRPRLLTALVPRPYQPQNGRHAHGISGRSPGPLFLREDGTTTRPDDLSSTTTPPPTWPEDEEKRCTKNWLIHWRGENVEGYSLSFRHDEFRSALLAVAREETEQSDVSDGNDHHRSLVMPHITFTDALWMNATTSTIAPSSSNNKKTDDSSPFRGSSQYPTSIKEEAYNQAMQYMSISTDDDGEKKDALIYYLYHPTLDHLVKAARRCSLIHALYQIVATSASTQYEALCDGALALAGGGATTAAKCCWLDDMTDPVRKLSWCIRVRYYRSTSVALAGALPRYGHRARSIRREREAVAALTPLLRTFTGPVRLEHPDCKIYIFDGLLPPPPPPTSSSSSSSLAHHQSSSSSSRRDDHNENVTLYHNNVLARRIAQGVRTSILNPNTRRCVTNTPLCPTAAVLMCNIGQVRRCSTVLDPYAGSGGILLAVSLLEPTVRTVGIEIAHDGLVDRVKIREDFFIRDELTPPVALLHGDCTDPSIRQAALAAIGGGPFDCILTDPPYGIRESLLAKRPIDDLLDMIRDDRDAGRPLLRKHGRLVVYLPQSDDEPLWTHVLPTTAKMEEAGLRLELTRKQYLSDVLNRWLVSFVCLC